MVRNVDFEEWWEETFGYVLRSRSNWRDNGSLVPPILSLEYKVLLKDCMIVFFVFGGHCLIIV